MPDEAARQSNDTPMMIVPMDPRANVSIMRGGRHISGPTRPIFSFAYDAMQFSMNVRSYMRDGVSREMTPEEIAEVSGFLEGLTVDEARSRRYAESKRLIDYLASTDWYVIRQLEAGKPVPEDITQARARAREAIDWS